MSANPDQRAAAFAAKRKNGGAGVAGRKLLYGWLVNDKLAELRALLYRVLREALIILDRALKQAET